MSCWQQAADAAVDGLQRSEAADGATVTISTSCARRVWFRTTLPRVVA